MWPSVILGHAAIRRAIALALGLSRTQAVIYARHNQRQSVGSTTVTEF
jgi:hypothetical protein